MFIEYCGEAKPLICRIGKAADQSAHGNRGRRAAGLIAPIDKTSRIIAKCRPTRPKGAQWKADVGLRGKRFTP